MWLNAELISQLSVITNNIRIMKPINYNWQYLVIQDWSQKSKCIIKHIKSESEGKTHLYNGVERLPDNASLKFVMLQYLISETALYNIIKNSMKSYKHVSRICNQKPQYQK